MPPIFHIYRNPNLSEVFAPYGIPENHFEIKKASCLWAFGKNMQIALESVEETQRQIYLLQMVLLWNTPSIFHILLFHRNMKYLHHVVSRWNIFKNISNENSQLSLSYNYWRNLCFEIYVQVELNTENNMLQGTSSTFQFIDVSFIAIFHIVGAKNIGNMCNR